MKEGGGKIKRNLHRYHLSTSLIEPSDWSVKMRLWKFSAMGHDEISAETFDLILLSKAICVGDALM